MNMQEAGSQRGLRAGLLLTGSLGLLLAISGCGQKQEATPADQSEVMAADADMTSTDNTAMIAQNTAAGMNWFGGPTYTGEPALDATAALVKAGGGAENFSFATALVSMLGQEAVNNEMAKLNAKYGEAAVKNFIDGMDYAVKDGLKRATEAGVTLPAPAPLEGIPLAKALIEAGTTEDGTFWSGYLFDKALSHDLHNQVMGDIEAEHGAEMDLNVHKILNQAMYDTAQALGMTNVKLASLN